MKFKLPFWTDDYNVYIFDANNNIVLQWMTEFNYDGANKIIEAINSENPLGLGDISIDKSKEIISVNGKPILRIRDWGYLTGSGGLRLSPQEAFKEQDKVLNYIVKCLK